MPDDDVRASSAAGAPLVRSAAIKDGGGAAGPSAWIGGAEAPARCDVPESTAGATGAGVDGEDTATEAGAAG